MQNAVLFRQTKSGRYLIKVVAMALTLLLICVALTGCYSFRSEKSKKTEDYSDYRSNVPYAEAMMPDCERDIGNYESVRFGYRKTIVTFFQSEGLSLTVAYDDENYESAKSDMLARYAFLEEPIRSENGDCIIPAASFKHRGYFFQIVTNPAYSGGYECKSFMMVGYNDKKQKIAYLYFYDVDIDMLLGKIKIDAAERMYMSLFITQYFAWSA